MATPQEVEKLKREWLADPCWDIEDTEGFEDHREELAAFNTAQQAKWEKAQQDRLLAKAEQLGVPGNTALAQYVMSLERRVSALEEKLGN